MPYKSFKIIAGLITGFVALTAIGGGLALLSGAEGARFPLEWLQGTPFNSYTLPALLLTLVVGGSALLASIAIFRNLKNSVIFSFIAGSMLMGFIVVEILILRQTPPGPTPIEILYVALGLAIWLLAGLIWKNQPKQSGR